jgi:outer membrane beta-barrel protein
MEVSRLRLLFLGLVLATTLPGCAWFHRDRDAAAESVPATSDAATAVGMPSSEQPIINPQVERRTIKRAKIDTEDFESHAVYGARLAYHLTEDFFLEGTLGQSRAGKTSYETLSGSAELLTDSERDYTYYALSAGWNDLPGEVFIGKNRAYNTAFYVVAGIGSTRFAGDDRFTVNGGFGYRILPNDWMAVHFDVRDYVYDTDLLGSKKIVNNLEAHLGLSIFF